MRKLARYARGETLCNPEQAEYDEAEAANPPMTRRLLVWSALATWIEPLGRGGHGHTSCPDVFETNGHSIVPSEMEIGMMFSFQLLARLTSDLEDSWSLLPSPC